MGLKKHQFTNFRWMRELNLNKRIMILIPDYLKGNSFIKVKSIN